MGGQKSYNNDILSGLIKNKVADLVPFRDLTRLLAVVSRAEE